MKHYCKSFDYCFQEKKYGNEIHVFSSNNKRAKINKLYVYLTKFLNTYRN